MNLLAFVALGVAAVRQWHMRRDRAAKWAAVTFGVLGLIVVAGRVLPERPDHLLEHFSQRVLIALLLLFPYLLYRFTRAFRGATMLLERAMGGMTLVMLVWTFALPHRLPAEGEPRPGWFITYLIGFLVHWTVLSVVVTYRLWQAGAAQPGVARRRMRNLASASAVLTVAIFLVAASSDEDSALNLISQVLAFGSAIGFLFGLAPPPVLRLMWRRAEQERLQNAIGNLIAFATGPREIASRVLQPMAEIVGAGAITMRDADGSVIARWERPGAVDSETLEIPFAGGSFIVRTSPYAPFFGDDELRLLRTLGGLTGLALDRARLFAQEHELRVALERADELKTNFVALAAHELRTPVTAIHGFVHTLHHRADLLGPDQQEELRRALEQQTLRMASLVEQLLDLSRLDAEAIEINRQTLRVRDRLEGLVQAAAGEHAESVELSVPEGLEASVDPVVLERVVGNLVTNAIRYGAPPVLVTAQRSDRHFRISVEDRGRGVPAAFVPDLFERFARSEASRNASGGTGLGLAIARSYARAHHGDLFYEPAQPHGARFELVLPA